MLPLMAVCMCRAGHDYRSATEDHSFPMSAGAGTCHGAALKVPAPQLLLLLRLLLGEVGAEGGPGGGAAKGSLALQRA